MAPEQARGEDAVDHLVDIYALGVILYEGLCGRPPFVGANHLAVLTKHISERPLRPSKLRPDLTISAALENIVLKALAKEPRKRFQDAQELGGQLAAVRATLGPCTAPTGSVTPAPLTASQLLSTSTLLLSKRGSRVALGLVLAAGMAGAVWTLWPWPPPPGGHSGATVIADAGSGPSVPGATVDPAADAAGKNEQPADANPAADAPADASTPATIDSSPRPRRRRPAAKRRKGEFLDSLPK
jgi:serine/threonine-protein kinase